MVCTTQCLLLGHKQSKQRVLERTHVPKRANAHLERSRVSGNVSSATMAREKDGYLGRGFPISVKKDFPSQLMHFRFFS